MNFDFIGLKSTHTSIGYFVHLSEAVDNNSF
jgi:hypothetical protein